MASEDNVRKSGANGAKQDDGRACGAVSCVLVVRTGMDGCGCRRRELKIRWVVEVLTVGSLALERVQEVWEGRQVLKCDGRTQASEVNHELSPNGGHKPREVRFGRRSWERKRVILLCRIQHSSIPAQLRVV